MEHPYRHAEPTIETPPRHVPRDVRRRVLYDSKASRGMWACVLVWAFVICLMGPSVHVPEPSYPASTTGRVVHVETIDSEDGTSYRVDAEFVDGTGHVRTARGWADDPPYAGDRVSIDYGEHVARIHGMRDGSISAIAFAAVMLGFGVATFGFAATAYRRGHAALRLLERGALAPARLVDRAEIGDSETPRTKLTFELELADGSRYRHEVSTATPSRFETADTVLCDPTWPDRAVLLDELPGRPRIDDDGRIRLLATSGLGLALAPLALALTVLGIVRLF